MFDRSCLESWVKEYKNSFVKDQWPNEKYKWEAIKHFQENWDIDSIDFTEMLLESLSQTHNLLNSGKYFPKNMIVGFCKNAPEDVRAMFQELFDESKDIYERIKNFKDNSKILLKKYGNGAAQHYQYENAIFTYLWLRYPDKYYIY